MAPNMEVTKRSVGDANEKEIASKVNEEAAPQAPNDQVLEFSPASMVRKRRMPRWLQHLLSDLFVFVTIHYNLWASALAVLLLYWVTHGHAVLAATLVLLYIPVYFNGKENTAEGWQWDRFRHSRLWLTFQVRWKMLIFREQELDGNKQYIFGYHPHGIMVMSRLATYAKTFETLFPGVDCRALAATSVFQVPLARELCLWMGAVDASRPIATKVLEAGKSMTVYPGGIREMYNMLPDSKETKLILKSRLGFIKLALKFGCDLVPTMVFNEKYMYHVYSPPPNVHAWLKKHLPFPAVMFWGRFLWMPRNMPKGKPFGVVYGKAIPVSKNENPTDEEIHELHDKYMSEVERLFREYKGKYGYDDDEKLVIT